MDLQKELGRVEKELRFVQEQIQKLQEAGMPSNPSFQQQQYTLLYRKREITEEIAKKERAQSYVPKSFKTHASQNPPIDILINLYVDGHLITATPNEYMRVDSKLNLHSTKKPINDREIEQLQYQIKQLKSQSSTNDQMRYMLDEYIDRLRLAELPFKPEFYVALGDIQSLVDITQFTSSYKGENRSPEKVEANIAALLKILFDRKEIHFNNQLCQIVNYEWRKSVFPPYGYQTSRGDVDIRTVKKPNVHLNEFRGADDLINYLNPTTVVNANLPEKKAAAFPVAETQLDQVVNDPNFKKGFETAIARYTTPVFDKNNISRNNHGTVTPDFYYAHVLSTQSRHAAFMYEYIAYRFSIYHTFFSPDDWTIYSQLPYFASTKKNSEIVERLVMFAPEPEVKTAVVELLNYWLIEDKRFYRRATYIQYRTQLLYMTRMSMQMNRRLEFMQLGLNYTILQVILKEVIRCANDVRKKDGSVRCISKVAQLATTEYFKPIEVPQLTMLAVPTTTVLCDTTTRVIDPALINAIHAAEFKIHGCVAVVGEVPSMTDELKFPTTSLEILQQIKELNDRLKEERAKESVRLYVSTHHELPPTHQCVLDHIRRLQIYQFTIEMNAFITEVNTERTTMKTIHAELQNLLQVTCLSAVKTILKGSDCMDAIVKAYEKIRVVASGYIQRANTGDTNVAYHMLDEKYDPWYADLDLLQAKYKTTFQEYGTVVENLGKVIAGIQKDDEQYNRGIHQLDYCVEAFELVSLIQPDLTPISIPEHCKNVMDFKKINVYLNILYDLLENKVIRGGMWTADTNYYIPLRCNQEFEVETRTLMTKIITRKGDIMAQFASLNPDCVLTYLQVDWNDSALGDDLYNNAKLFLKQGRFALGIEAVRLSLMFSETGSTDEESRHKHNLRVHRARLLYYLCTSTGKQVHELNETPTPEESKLDYKKQNESMLDVLFPTSEAYIISRIKHILYAPGSAHFVSDLNNTLLKTFEETADPKHAQYKQALLNYSCIQAALKSATARKILTNPHLDVADIAKVLNFFPQKYIVNNLIAQIYDARRDTNYQVTFKFVAAQIIQHRTRGRVDVVDDACKDLDIRVPMKSLSKTLIALNMAAKTVTKAATERESGWPNKMEMSVWGKTKNAFKMINKTVGYPYVDGNYSIRVVVDLRLSTKTFKPAETCEENYVQASEVLDALVGSSKKKDLIASSSK